MKKELKQIFSDVLFITRGNDERTMNINNQMLLDLGIPKENVILLLEKPSSRAVLKSFELLVKSEFNYLYRVDGDIILDFEEVVKFIRKAKNASTDVFVTIGFVHCKYFGIWRFGGNYFYNRKSIEEIQESEVGSLYRPDSTLHKIKHKQGRKIIKLPVKIGYHGYEQEPIDLLNTGFVQGEKHKRYMKHLIARWSKLSINDKDFVYLLDGFCFSIRRDKEGLKNELNKLKCQKKKDVDSCYNYLDEIKNNLNVEEVDGELEFVAGGLDSNIYEQYKFFKRLHLKNKVLHRFDKFLTSLFDLKN